ncbi:Membrane protein involved in the export of O-antigen and teichoic acid [Roseicitreum antarcticum]|uniref:Membrane protein involved in the export of O-antigen and teichoic acid n=2 Tax=Roseicitreum antarcticum TaxID=564137 RepID=A0A1H2QXG6_9RHOB|nr:Membrane protein involved in the export of O-antigen and teichoic acid [Roseicitreum antarcticum]
MQAVLQGFQSRFMGNGLISRVMRGSVVTVIGFGGGQALRLAGNLILTRLLVPEAFGLMALVTVVVIGLKMFSDVGIMQSIMRSPRGDEPEFLNTAWTLDVIRGFIIWGLACLMAWPMAQFYGSPELQYIIPVAAMVLVFAGFEPSNVDSAARHLALGRVTMLDLLSQFVAIVTMVALALVFRSVWALVAGQLVGSVAKLLLMHFGLPGIRNAFRLERCAVRELVGFGKWVFLSTVAGFLALQGDKLILGKFLTLEMLGIYNIGYFLASVPVMLAYALVGRMVIPVYRETPPAASRANFLLLRRMRFSLTGALVALSAMLALSGVSLVDLLYDDRYVQSGPILVLLSVAFMVQIIGMGYDQIALAMGDSRRFFAVTAVRSVLLLGCVLIGVMNFGLVGALLGQGVAFVLTYPFIVWLARRYGAWDPLHDATMAAATALVAALALWINLDAVATLLNGGGV